MAQELLMKNPKGDIDKPRQEIKCIESSTWYGGKKLELPRLHKVGSAQTKILQHTTWQLAGAYVNTVNKGGT